jgi:uncharacterized protein
MNFILFHPKIKVAICQEFLDELNQVIARPKFSKYITNDLKELLLNSIKLKSEIHSLDFIEPISRDKNDDYLLGLSKKSNADFLISGDKDLLVLIQFLNTKIIQISEFELILLNIE